MFPSVMPNFVMEETLASCRASLLKNARHSHACPSVGQGKWESRFKKL